MSLPASRRLWHCPFVVIYYSDDGLFRGKGYRELALVRFDGEGWEEDEAASNEMNSSFDESFMNWDEWKRRNREGVDCIVHVEWNKNRLTLQAEAAGMHLVNITTLSEDFPELYMVLTGDQVALTDIHIL